jgi:hypothetical protein
MRVDNAADLWPRFVNLRMDESFAGHMLSSFDTATGKIQLHNLIGVQRLWRNPHSGEEQALPLRLWWEPATNMSIDILKLPKEDSRPEEHVIRKPPYRLTPEVFLGHCRQVPL